MSELGSDRLQFAIPAPTVAGGITLLKRVSDRSNNVTSHQHLFCEPDPRTDVSSNLCAVQACSHPIMVLRAKYGDATVALGLQRSARENEGGSERGRRDARAIKSRKVKSVRPPAFSSLHLSLPSFHGARPHKRGSPAGGIQSFIPTDSGLGGSQRRLLSPIVDNTWPLCSSTVPPKQLV